TVALSRKGQDEELVEGRAGALGARVEEAHRLDLVAEELDPRGAHEARREDVDDTAAEAPLPDFDDGVDALVAGALERREQGLAVEGVADRKPQRARRELRRRRELGVERRGGDDEDRKSTRLNSS